MPAMARLNIQINGPPADLAPDKSQTFYDDQILAPISSPHPIPVPRAPAFGKLATTAQIGPSGIVEKLEYNKAAALSDLLNSGAQIYNQTAAELDRPSRRAAGPGRPYLPTAAFGGLSA